MTDVTNFVQPFDFKTIILNYFLGDQNLFIYLLVVGIAFVCAYFQMSNRNFLIILILASTLFAFYLGSGVYFLILLAIGLIVYKSFSRLFKN